jgi:hypothetical protein
VSERGLGFHWCLRGGMSVLVPFSCWVDRSKPRYKSSSDIV